MTEFAELSESVSHPKTQKQNVQESVDANPNPVFILPSSAEMATPFLAGLAIAAAALAGKYGIQAWQTLKTRPPKPRVRRFYDGGFQPTMTKREAALILGVRENATPDKVKEAHRRVMVANHPDAGGSHYLASKINEAKDVMLGKTKGSGSAF
ncbi:Mitochondrial import inner membrane translocase subunit TIM14-1 [Camellia lanceoleosa]|uniref:Mitochondrial import inner membrane translocase subunit TIM14-1 n=1 Tax=Camellia lanceoleosa TaxID=1840588 RepID=A0ACC0GXB5_9ERIC|nr:Mitochondrial import inner membrane translocase subunit TIM14-1 [Camellia lanceoleosa]